MLRILASRFNGRVRYLRCAGQLVRLLTALAGTAAMADIGPMPMSLKGVPVPTVPGLYNGANPIVVDRNAALILGKALFWDSNVGSDGMACASCHFHAGADRRARNQLAPGGKHTVNATFDRGSDGQVRGPNQTLRKSDFPFTQPPEPLQDVSNHNPLTRQSDDVVGSGGSFGGTFKAVSTALTSHDTCVRQADGTYRVAGMGTRRVVARNAPTVINAVFNDRLLWDGRANNIFNGSSSGGTRDTASGVWVQQADGSVRRQKLALANSALASQALTAPMDSTEMACDGRSMADLGRKLLMRSALEMQRVHPQDSVLGPVSNSLASGQPQPGLNTHYASLVENAFHPRFWASTTRGPFGKPALSAQGATAQAYSQMESNFGLFFGIALQVYQSTLVSDDSPFDRSTRDAQGIPLSLHPAAQRGLQRFRTAHCAVCHVGPAFTSAAVGTNAALVASHPRAFGDNALPNQTSGNVVTRLAAMSGMGFVDTGFASTGVAPDDDDAGLGGKDSFGIALALSAQYVRLLAGDTAAVLDPRVAQVRACDLPFAVALNRPTGPSVMFTQREGVFPQNHSTTGCLKPLHAFVPAPDVAAAELASPTNQRLRLLTQGAFKIPTLRNVELTGPYMHNGSMATLDQVIEFYTRGGNHTGPSKQFGTVFGQPALQVDPTARAELKAFLESLTDERVRYERAPFDHPELKVPHGHEGDRNRISATHALGNTLAQDQYLVLPAVGAQGLSTPLQPFHSYLEP